MSNVGWLTGTALGMTLAMGAPQAIQASSDGNGGGPNAAAVLRNADEGAIPVANGFIHYESEGRGPAVVLIAAFAADGRIWNLQAPALRNAGYRVIRIEPRGFGQSSLPVEGKPYSHADDIATVLDALSIRRAHIVGVSNGGRIAIDFALTHPERSLTLVAIDAAVSGSFPPEELKPFFASVHDAAVAAGPDAAKAKLVTLDLFQQAFRRPAERALLQSMMARYGAWHFLHDDPEQASDAIRRLGEIHVPTLALLGDRDMPYWHRAFDAISTGIPNAKGVTLSGIGHFANLEAPDRVNAAMLAFFAKASARAQR